MGRATIVSEAGEGLYTAQVVFDGSNVATVQAAIDQQIADLEDQVEVAEDEIAEVEKEVAKYEEAMAEKGEVWNQTVAEEMEEDPENVTHPDAEDPEHETAHVSFEKLEMGYINDLTARFADPVYEAPPTWSAETPHTRGDRIRPGSDTGWQYRCRTDGTTGTEEPAWSTEENGTTLDGTAIWATVAVAEEVAPGAVAVYRAAGTVSYKGIVGGDEEEKPEGYEGLAEAPMERTVNRGRLDKAYLDYVAAAIQCHAQQNRLVSVEKFRDMALYRIEALEKKKAELAAAVGTGDPREMWCADYTEELSGEVDTVEINGSPVPAIQIAPGGASELTAGSKLANIMAMSPSGAALAWMLLPGWQRWRPTYRVGTIHDIDYEAGTASVTLDEAVSIAQGLNIVPTTELTGIRGRYMECDLWAFEEDDRVVVEFVGQINSATEASPTAGPVVVGFETAPRPCSGYAAIFGSTAEDLPDYDDADIYCWGQGASSLSEYVVTPVPATSSTFNGAWRRGARLKCGARWKYPLQFDDGRYYRMRLRLWVNLYNLSGYEIGSIEVKFAADDGPSRNIGNGQSEPFFCSYKSGTGSAGWVSPSPSPGDPCYEAMIEKFGPYASSWPNAYFLDTTGGGVWAIENINNLGWFDLNCVNGTYSEVDPDYEACSGRSAGSEARAVLWAPDLPGGGYSSVSEDYQPGLCPSPWTTIYLGLEDPSGQMLPEHTAQLYDEQSWSMEGVIDEAGVTLRLSTDPVRVRGIPSPVGPWPTENAGSSEYHISVPAQEDVHHIGFKVQGILTADGAHAAIVTGESPDGAPFLCTNAGQIDFYAVVVPPWED